MPEALTPRLNQWTGFYLQIAPNKALGQTGSVPDFARFRRGSVHQLSTRDTEPIEDLGRLARCRVACKKQQRAIDCVA